MVRGAKSAGIQVPGRRLRGSEPRDTLDSSRWPRSPARIRRSRGASVEPNTCQGPGVVMLNHLFHPAQQGRQRSVLGDRFEDLAAIVLEPFDRFLWLISRATPDIPAGKPFRNCRRPLTSMATR